MASFGSEVAQENQSNFGIKLGPRNQHNSSHWHPLYIYIWLMVSAPLKHMKVNGKDDQPIHEIEHKIHVPNHQPDMNYHMLYHGMVGF